jgi:hypothetical protein
MKGWQWARSLLTMFLIAAAHAPCTFLKTQRVFKKKKNRSEASGDSAACGTKNLRVLNRIVDPNPHHHFAGSGSDVLTEKSVEFL